MSKFKRVLCLLMTVIMLVGMMPSFTVNAAIYDNINGNYYAFGGLGKTRRTEGVCL